MLSSHYGMLSSITAFLKHQEHIRIDIRYSESLQGSQVLYPGLWNLKSWIPSPVVLDPGTRVLGFWVLGAGSRVLGSGVLILDYAMKFGQLIEYYTRNIFLQKSRRK